MQLGVIVRGAPAASRPSGQAPGGGSPPGEPDAASEVKALSERGLALLNKLAVDCLVEAEVFDLGRAGSAGTVPNFAPLLN